MRSTMRYWLAIGLVMLVSSVFWLGRSPVAARTTASGNPAPLGQGGEPFDEGDAPDETNTLGLPMTTYGGTPAKFPTVFNGGLPNGPSHMNISTYFLGNGVTAETEADSGFDADGANNIQPAANIADADLADDAFYLGLPSMAAFGHCQGIQLPYRVTATAAVPASTKAYVNVWIDWDRSGAWGGGNMCGQQTFAKEWAVQNQIITLTGPSVYNLSTTPFLAWVPPGVARNSVWLRITVSNTPATNDDGRGPPNRWQFGETEDYLLPQEPTQETPTPTAHSDITPTKTPINDITPTATSTPQSGVITSTPTSTPGSDITPEPTKTPINDITPTATSTPQSGVITSTPTSTPGSDITPTATNTPEATKTPIIPITPTATPAQGEAVFDLGDAPDSTNSSVSGMTTYISAVPARFPTVYNAVAPFGPLHRDTRLFNLGPAVTNEQQADTGFDTDGVRNIVPPSNTADQDRADDGLLRPRTMAGLPHCVPTVMAYTVQYNGTGTRQVFFNMWADWNRNGAWGGAMECQNVLAKEWAVNNQVITLVPGLNTFTAPAFLPWHGSGRAALWFRMTVSDTAATADDGSGPALGWRFGETEDYFLSPDVGDAPDSQNSLLVPMRAYAWPWWVWAKFPTVYNRLPASAPRGPLHQNLGLPYVLGDKLSAEGEADVGADDDSINNLLLGPRTANHDRADDAFGSAVPTMNSFKHCQPQTLNYRVTVPSSPPPSGTTTAYVNVWIDWNRNGAWGGAKKCIGSDGLVRVANEWAVQNQPLSLTGPAVYNLTTPAFTPYAAQWPRPSWLRISISNTPATHADGRGPNGGWTWGETEDYLLKAGPIHGEISGTVHALDGAVLPNTFVHVFGYTVTNPLSATGSLVLVGTTTTDEQGNYSFDDLAPGSYSVVALHNGFRPQWFDHTHEQAAATPIVVTGGSVATANFDLHPPTPPLVGVATGGVVSYNNDGQFVVRIGRLTPTTVSLIVPSGCITCPNNVVPSNPRLVVRYPGSPAALLTLPLTLNPISNTYNITLTVAMLNALFSPNHSVVELYLMWDCGATTITKFIGRIEIIDPSGFVTNIATGAPIEGATVRLYHVPEWRAKTDPTDDDLDTCESNESRIGAPWSQPAPTEQGIVADGNLVLMSPDVGSQTTGADGYYGWNVGPGCWYVVASAPGYTTRVSPVVGVPSAVTDLDIQLIEIRSQVFLPFVNR